MEMILKLNGLQRWDAVLALLVVTHTAYLTEMFLKRYAARIIVAFMLKIQHGLVQKVMPIKPLPRICVLVKRLRVVQNHSLTTNR
jgi:hypothetical protein